MPLKADQTLYDLTDVKHELYGMAMLGCEPVHVLLSPIVRQIRGNSVHLTTVAGVVLRHNFVEISDETIAILNLDPSIHSPDMHR